MSEVFTVSRRICGPVIPLSLGERMQNEKESARPRPRSREEEPSTSERPAGREMGIMVGRDSSLPGGIPAREKVTRHAKVSNKNERRCRNTQQSDRDCRRRPARVSDVYHDQPVEKVTVLTLKSKNKR
jgi:hypothetical protein